MNRRTEPGNNGAAGVHRKRPPITPTNCQCSQSGLKVPALPFSDGAHNKWAVIVDLETCAHQHGRLTDFDYADTNGTAASSMYTSTEYVLSGVSARALTSYIPKLYRTRTYVHTVKQHRKSSNCAGSL